jgi:hypothetical protein
MAIMRKVGENGLQKSLCREKVFRIAKLKQF